MGTRPITLGKYAEIRPLHVAELFQFNIFKNKPSANKEAVSLGQRTYVPVTSGEVEALLRIGLKMDDRQTAVLGQDLCKVVSYNERLNENILSGVSPVLAEALGTLHNHLLYPYPSFSAEKILKSYKKSDNELGLLCYINSFIQTAILHGGFNEEIMAPLSGFMQLFRRNFAHYNKLYAALAVVSEHPTALIGAYRRGNGKLHSFVNDFRSLIISYLYDSESSLPSGGYSERIFQTHFLSHLPFRPRRA
jgi:hypothetical protein